LIASSAATTRPLTQPCWRLSPPAT